MSHRIAAFLLAGSFLTPFAGAHASIQTTANLAAFAPVSGTATVIALQGFAAPTNTTITGSGYTITFGGVSSGQAPDAGPAIVAGDIGGQHAIPIAGMSGSNMTYLTGDFGSAQTTDSSKSGKYLSTGASPGSITITFNTLQSSLELLWGSIDTGNSLQFYGANNQLIGTSTADNTVTGADVQAAANGFTSNGSRSFGGSSYVTLNSSQAFKSVVARSSTPSFEFASVVGSTQSIAVPEPTSLLLVGSGLAAFGLLRRRRRS